MRSRVHAVTAAGVVIAAFPFTATVMRAHHARPASRPHLYHITAGVNTSWPALTVNKFIPDRLTIHAGDSVQWTNAVGNEPQTVTFGSIESTPPLITRADAAEINPQVVKPQNGHIVGDTAVKIYSSGALMAGVRGLSNSYTFTFPILGTYFYRSLFHPDSLGEIDVVATNKAASPDNLDRGPSMYDGLKSAAQALQDERPPETTGGIAYQGGTQIQVATGNRNVTINKFTPSGLTIKVGSTLTFVAKEQSGDPHAVVINPDTTSELGRVSRLYTGLSADGGLVINPAYTKASVASGASIMPGRRVVSGILYGSSVNYPSQVPSSYTITFAGAGGYSYVDPFQPGMFGQIQVIP